MDFKWLTSDGTLLGSFLTEQSVIKQKPTHNEMIAVKLHSTVDVQMKQNNDEQQYFTCKDTSKILGNIIAISQIIFQFLNVVFWEIWEINILRYLSSLVKTLSMSMNS